MQITLKQARLMREKTQEQMAKTLGIHVQTYRKIEENPDVANVEQVKTISNVLGFDYDDLFFGGVSTFSRQTERKYKSCRFSP